MEIYLLRHGLAGDPGTWAGDDSQRPLTNEGRKRMLRTGDTLAALKIKPQLILSSPLRRAIETAQLAARAMDAMPIMHQDVRLSPGFDIDALRLILEDHPDIDTLMLVGHEPDFSMLAGAICGGEVVMKKGGLARLTITDREALKGQLVWLLPPKVLAR